MKKYVCPTCCDTHQITLHQEGEHARSVMCTYCPSPCQECRSGGNGPFCETTPCPCYCHKESWQYKGIFIEEDPECTGVGTEVIASPPDDVIDIRGHFDEKNQVEYLEKAHRQEDESYHALANVGGALCIVQCSIRRQLYPCSRKAPPRAEEQQ